jgi:hypothetical protein
LYRGTPTTGVSAEAGVDDEFDQEVALDPSTELHRSQRTGRKKLRRDDVLCEPQLRLISNDEVIDVEPARREFLSIQDKVDRLLQTLEHERREKAVLQKKYDQLCSAYYLQEQAQSAWKAAGLNQLSSSLSYGVVPQTGELQRPSDVYQPHTTSKHPVIPFPSFPPPSLFPLYLQQMAQAPPSQSNAPPFPFQSTTTPATDDTPKKPVKTLEEFFSPSSRGSKIAANSIRRSTSATAASLPLTKDIPSSTEATLNDESKPQADDTHSVEAKGDNDNGQGRIMREQVEVLEVLRN